MHPSLSCWSDDRAEKSKSDALYTDLYTEDDTAQSRDGHLVTEPEGSPSSNPSLSLHSSQDTDFPESTFQNTSSDPNFNHNDPYLGFSETMLDYGLPSFHGLINYYQMDPESQSHHSGFSLRAPPTLDNVPQATSPHAESSLAVSQASDSAGVFNTDSIHGQTVPQRVYKSRTGKRSWTQPITRITFTVGENSGILVRDALDKKCSGLKGHDDSVFVDECGPSVFLRYEWPGYKPWNIQMKTKDWSSPKKPITLAKLSNEIAKSLVKFIRESELVDPVQPDDSKWRVGCDSDRINADNLYLVDLTRVSKGSWQPSFRVLDN